MLTDPIQTAQNAALAAIARLADAGHRLANEHAYALDQLRQENEALRRQNQALRERVAELEHRCEHTAEVLANVQPVDTEAGIE
jgi:1,6-anhydro-N-acetylmuramate kinase